MKTFFGSVALVLLAACASEPYEAFVDPSGRTRYVVECLDNEKFCEPKAKELCPAGYTVTMTRSQVVAIWQGVDVVNRIRFRMAIECN